MPEDPEIELETRPFIDMIPTKWRTGPDLWCSAYQMVRVPTEALKEPVTIDLGKQLVVFFWGQMPRLSIDSALTSTTEGSLQVEAKSEKGSHHPPGPTALILTPIESEWTPETINRCRYIAQQAAGLLSMHSQSLVYAWLEDYVIRVQNGMIDPTAAKIVSGAWLQPVGIAEPLIGAFEDAGRTLDAHPDSDRLGLALRWIDQATRTEGIDSFLRAWIALETLAMPDTTNIRPMNVVLGQIYEMPHGEAKEHFLTGQLFRLRTSIVHHGDSAPIEDKLILYMQALFKDLFSAELGPSAALAHAMLEDDELSIRAYLINRAAGLKN
jgi:hypothetical protein